MPSSVFRSLLSCGEASRSCVLSADENLQTYGLAVVTMDYEKQCDRELRLLREKLNDLIASSKHLQHLLIWDRLQNFCTSPFHHTIRSLQNYNVQGLCVAMRHTTLRNSLNTIFKIFSRLWPKRILGYEEFCPPIPILLLVYGDLKTQETKMAVKRKLQRNLDSILPTSMKSLRLTKIKLITSDKTTEKAAEDAAWWLQSASKRFRRQFYGVKLWKAISWEIVFRQESLSNWKKVAQSFAVAEKIATPRYRPKRSRSEPVFVPRRKPVTKDETGVSYGEEAAAVAVQLKNVHRLDGIWAFKCQRTMYLYAVFQQLTRIQESVRAKLIHRRQYFEESGTTQSGSCRSKSREKFYTKFQWVKSYSRDSTDQLMLYFCYGTVVQFCIARTKYPLTPCDLQILRTQLLAHAEYRASQRRIIKAARVKTLLELWNKLQPRRQPRRQNPG